MKTVTVKRAEIGKFIKANGKVTQPGGNGILPVVEAGDLGMSGKTIAYYHNGNLYKLPSGNAIEMEFDDNGSLVDIIFHKAKGTEEWFGSYLESAPELRTLANLIKNI